MKFHKFELFLNTLKFLKFSILIGPPSLEGGNRLRTFLVRVLPLHTPSVCLASALGESYFFFQKKIQIPPYGMSVLNQKSEKMSSNLTFLFQKKYCNIQKKMLQHFVAKKAKNVAKCCKKALQHFVPKCFKSKKSKNVSKSYFFFFKNFFKFKNQNQIKFKNQIFFLLQRRAFQIQKVKKCVKILLF